MFLKRLLALVFGLVLAIGAAELALRAIGFHYPLYPEEITFGYPDPQKLERIYRPDEALFWTPKDYADRLEQATGAVDWVVMGDSCTELGKYDQYLAALVASRHPGQTVSFVNLGCAGWSSRQGRAQMERDVPKLAPKIATIYYGWNDHWVGFGIEDEEVAGINDSLLYKLRDSRLIQFVQISVLRRGREEKPKRVSLEQFAENHRRLVRSARDAGITPILITAPSAQVPGREPGLLAGQFLDDLSVLVPTHREYVDTLRRVAEEEDAILCDLAARFDAIPIERRVRELFISDGIHLRPAGDRIIAQALFECLEESGLLETLLSDEAGAVQLAGRESAFRAEPEPKGDADPSLPVHIEVEEAFVRSAQGFLISGFALAPAPIDHIVVHIAGHNVGSARYPVHRPELSETHPAYLDTWAGFAVQRLIDFEVEAPVEARLVVWSGDEILAEQDVTFRLLAPDEEP